MMRVFPRLRRHLAMLLAPDAAFLRLEYVKLHAELRSCLDVMRQAQDRIGMTRSLAVDLNTAFWLLDDALHRHHAHCPAPEPSRWRERRALIADLRKHAATLPIDEANTINHAATRMEAVR